MLRQTRLSSLRSVMSSRAWLPRHSRFMAFHAALGKVMCWSGSNPKRSKNLPRKASMTSASAKSSEGSSRGTGGRWSTPSSKPRSRRRSACQPPLKSCLYCDQTALPILRLNRRTAQVASAAANSKSRSGAACRPTGPSVSTSPKREHSRRLRSSVSFFFCSSRWRPAISDHRATPSRCCCCR